MPRILVIMDEFQILFDDSTNRKVAMRSANHAKRIVTEGRAYGVHLLMATQSTNIISTLTLDRGTIEQMRVRIGLKCGEDDARYLFSDRYERDALDKMVGPKGTAVMNPDYTEQYGNTGLRVAFVIMKVKQNISSKSAKLLPMSHVQHRYLKEVALNSCWIIFQIMASSRQMIYLCIFTWAIPLKSLIRLKS